jgi:hypothetical protein
MIHFIGLGAIVIVWLEAPVALAQPNSTAGDCSPIVFNVEGNVSISCSLLSNKVPVFKFSGEISSRTVKKFTKFIKAHVDDIIELDLRTDYHEEGQFYFVGSVGLPGQEAMQLSFQDPGGGVAYTFNSGFRYFRADYLVQGFFTILPMGEVRHSTEELIFNEIDKAHILTRGGINRK